MSERGYKTFRGRKESEFAQSVADRDWEIVLIPDAYVESAGEFIDRMRGD